MHRKATVNFDSPGTFKSAKSFLSFSTPHSTANLNSVGVSLGNSVNDIHVSTKSLRHIEFDRLKVTPKALSKSDTTLINEDEELHANTDGQLLCHLVGEVSEVDFGDAVLGLIFELKASGQKSKSSSTNKHFGHSRGLLLGIGTDTMDVLAHSGGYFHIKLKSNNFMWSLVAVYGADHDELEPTFLGELVNITKDNPYPFKICS
jgi:hypothetical protein